MNRFVVTMNTDARELCILDRQGTDSLTLTLVEADELVTALNDAAWQLLHSHSQFHDLKEKS